VHVADPLAMNPAPGTTAFKRPSTSTAQNQRVGAADGRLAPRLRASRETNCFNFGEITVVLAARS
jgi:hypothetical protein